MKFGVRECCDVVLRAKGTQKVGNKIFYKNEPVIYFDTLKTSSLEGSSSTVYAQGGTGNSRLMSWDGERTLTWSMEDALISPVGIMILTGAGLIDSGSETPITIHTTEQLVIPNTYGAPIEGQSGIDWKDPVTGENGDKIITLSYDPFDEPVANSVSTPSKEDYIYVMKLDSNGDISSEPFIGTRVGQKQIKIQPRYRKDEAGHSWDYHTKGVNTSASGYEDDDWSTAHLINSLQAGDVVLVDYYRQETAVGAAQEIQITPDKFGGSYYLEASTLFRNEDGIDMPAEFIIPNCRIQSNFTFTMASTGDPSSFNFTMDCFPDYTRWDKTKKVLAAIQVLSSGTGAGNELMRLETNHHGKYVYEDKDGIVRDTRFAKAGESDDSTNLIGVRDGQVDGYHYEAVVDDGAINYNPSNSAG